MRAHGLGVAAPASAATSAETGPRPHAEAELTSPLHLAAREGTGSADLAPPARAAKPSAVQVPAQSTRVAIIGPMKTLHCGHSIWNKQ